MVIKDRKKDLIIVSGFNVFPREIEDVTAECPGVADVCVIGIPHPRRGECPAAFVQPKVGADLTEAALEAWCEEKLSRYKLPKKFFLVQEVPKTKNRKPDRKRLRSVYEAMSEEARRFPEKT